MSSARRIRRRRASQSSASRQPWVDSWRPEPKAGPASTQRVKRRRGRAWCAPTIVKCPTETGGKEARDCAFPSGRVDWLERRLVWLDPSLAQQRAQLVRPWIVACRVGAEHGYAQNVRRGFLYRVCRLDRLRQHSVSLLAERLLEPLEDGTAERHLEPPALGPGAISAHCRPRRGPIPAKMGSPGTHGRRPAMPEMPDWQRFLSADDRETIERGRWARRVGFRRLAQPSSSLTCRATWWGRRTTTTSPPIPTAAPPAGLPFGRPSASSVRPAPPRHR